jgi:hypothetical protein
MYVALNIIYIFSLFLNDKKAIKSSSKGYIQVVGVSRLL